MRRSTLLVLGTLFGCSGPMESMSFEFSAEPIDQAQVSEWSIASMDARRHRLTLRQAIETTRDCSLLDADLVHAGPDLRLRVHEPGAGTEAAQTRSCGYTAVIEGIPTGRYNLRVVHSTGATRTGSVVLDRPFYIR